MTARRLFVLLAGVGLAVGCGPADAGEAGDGPGAEAADASAAAPSASADTAAGASSVAPGADGSHALDTIPGTAWTTEDWRIFEEKIRWAAAEGLDSVPAGDAIARLGRTFVGTTYTPGTLEAPGPEHLVINLRELDCVTFVENVLALVRFVRDEGVAALDDPAAARRAYEAYLVDLRYRDGVIAGYPSRLHYFSEWLAANEADGLLELVTGELGGVPDAEPIDFMSTHADAYRQLADPQVLAAVRATEERLNAAGPRLYIPEDRIGAIADRIRDGDIIAATSTVAGLDIAHTGIAIRVDGRLHLLHAPLVGRSVEISEVPLAERILGISGQDGIMVGRVRESSF